MTVAEMEMRMSVGEMLDWFAFKKMEQREAERHRKKISSPINPFPEGTPEAEFFDASHTTD